MARFRIQLHGRSRRDVHDLLMVRESQKRTSACVARAGRIRAACDDDDSDGDDDVDGIDEEGESGAPPRADAAEEGESRAAARMW